MALEDPHPHSDSSAFTQNRLELDHHLRDVVISALFRPQPSATEREEANPHFDEKMI